MKKISLVSILILAFFMTYCKVGRTVLPANNQSENAKQETTKEPAGIVAPKVYPSEYRGVWLMPFMEDLNSKEAITNAIKELKESNFNLVLPVAFRRGCAYYNSEIAPSFPPNSPKPDFDPLAEIISAAHNTSNGQIYMEVHPWIVVTAIWYEEDGISPKGHILSQHPEWDTSFDPPKTYDGKKWFHHLDPGVPQSGDYITMICEEIATKYNIDGINLDYIRYLEGGTGYNKIALERYFKETGKTEKPKTNDSDWIKWRQEQVTSIVKKVRQKLNQIDSQIILSACTIDWGSISNGFENTRTYNDVAQDCVLWCKEGLIDLNMPMNYRDYSNLTKQKEFEEWTKFAINNSGKAKVLNGLGAYLNTIDDTLRQVSLTQELKGQGIVIFRWGACNKETLPNQALFKKLKETMFKNPASGIKRRKF